MNAKTQDLDLTRRRFVGACCAGVGTMGLVSSLAQLRLMGAAASPDAPNEPARAGAPAPNFKALVCLFLAGGNDSNNLIVPADNSGYSAYAAARGALALPQSSLLPIGTAGGDGRAWALHPAMTELKSLHDRGKLAVVANLGTLAYPLTRDTYNARPELRPRQLFSHNDQQVEWQTSVADRPFSEVATGWGGRVADLTDALNSNSRISMMMTLAGQNTFQIGRNVQQYAVSTNGTIALTGSGTGTTVNGLRTAALNDTLAQQSPSLLEAAFGGLTNRALGTSSLLSSIITGTSPFAAIFNGITSTSLSQQLHMVARLINAQAQLNLTRQIFFVRVGGFDLHDNQVTLGNTGSGAHSTLLRDISRSLDGFYRALAQIGAENQVTTFTSSDFGRTYNTNGDGSDHGWGSHHLVLGGSVRGGAMYGQMPDLRLGGPSDSGTRGTWIPTTSVDEYAATLARWFGVSATNIPVIFPNIGRFPRPDLGFLAS
jgi:uncharacterized protein (DUF1501 family)